MTFERATDLAYLKTAVPDSVISSSWCYSVNIPISAAGINTVPGDAIPNSTGILPIFCDMEDVFFFW